MKILRATHLGMCFGVRDAIELARQTAAEKPLSILGDLVHNESVIQDLEQRGARVVRQLEEARTSAVMITAHGASDRQIARVHARGHEVIEATCPLVKHAHQAVLRLACEGWHPVIVGQRNHIEVRGLTGDLDAFDVILSPEDVQALPSRPRYGVAAQTTQPLARVHYLASLVRQRFPESEVKVVDTVCQPTKQRQSAAMELAAGSDVVIVVGGANSNNTRELAATCRRFCARVWQVQSAAEICASWFEGVRICGLTAGTSTPDDIIDAVEVRLRELAEVELVEMVAVGR